MMGIDQGQAAVPEVDKQQEEADHLDGECLGDLMFNVLVSNHNNFKI